MAVCHITVNAGTYGVGIRIAFYLQWFGMIITSWAPEPDALNLLNFINALTTAATSIGLVMSLDRLQPVEIYIVLLVTCGALYFTIPIYLWRLVTCCRPWWDPGRWTGIRTGWLFRVSTFSMYGALLSLHIWLWCRGIHDERKIDSNLDRDIECEQFGFLFAQLRLDDPALATVNIIIHLTIFFVGTGVFANRIGIFECFCWDRSQKRRRWRITTNRILSLQQFRSICDLIVATIVTMTVELVFSWNKITGANDLNSAAQLIPPVITGAFLVHGLCVWASGPDSDGEASSSSYYCPRVTEMSGRRRRASKRCRCPRRSSTRSSDVLDAYLDWFDLPPELFVQTPRASLGSHAGRYASGYSEMASDYYRMQSGDHEESQW